MNSQRLSIMTLAITLVAVSTIAQVEAPGGFDLSWHTVDSGGAASSGGTFTVTGTIGQPDASAALAGGAFTITGGFWAGAVRTCAADIAPGSGNGMVDIDDLLLVINQWGAAGGSADINHDMVVNIDDLLAVIIAWGACP